MSFVSFSFNPALISEANRDDFMTRFFSLVAEYQTLAFPIAAPATVAAAAVPDASEIPPLSDFVAVAEEEEQLDGGAQVSAAKVSKKKAWDSLTEEERVARLSERRSKRKMSDDSLVSEKSVPEMNHKELCKKYRDLRGRKHNPKYPYGGVPKAFSQTEDLRVEVLRIVEESQAAAPAEIPETMSQTSSKKPRKTLTKEERMAKNDFMTF